MAVRMVLSIVSVNFHGDVTILLISDKATVGGASLPSFQGFYLYKTLGIQLCLFALKNNL